MWARPKRFILAKHALSKIVSFGPGPEVWTTVMCNLITRYLALMAWDKAARLRQIRRLRTHMGALLPPHLSALPPPPALVAAPIQPFFVPPDPSMDLFREFEGQRTAHRLPCKHWRARSRLSSMQFALKMPTTPPHRPQSDTGELWRIILAIYRAHLS